MIRKLKNYYHYIQSLAAAHYFRHPAKELTIIGVTGTDGKTTTAHLIFHILKTAQIRVGLISTVGAEIGTKKLDTGFHVTTPNPFMVQSFLKMAKHEGLTHFVLEVTSHALDQNRVKHVPFSIGVLTNITHEHLDYHKSLTKYLQTKVRLLSEAKTAVVNSDDSSFPNVTKELQRRKFTGKILTYGLKDADITLSSVAFKTTLQGEYNMHNILAGIAVAKQLGIKERDITRAIASFELPTGRFEIVYKKDFTVVIDFAHTPNSLQQLLMTIKKDVAKHGKIIHVFGAAGERDATKRPVMGRISEKFADTIILTSEDPRHEKVEDINNAIRSEMKQSRRVISIPDRQIAIATAISMAKKGDVVAITGKGHETSMNMGSGEIPWSDQKAVSEILKL
jgi:UDP-N-acetylmuramoyl-L-alanyl-D-glutamate--2,6-diaminopimelate ligase